MAKKKTNCIVPAGDREEGTPSLVRLGGSEGSPSSFAGKEVKKGEGGRSLEDPLGENIYASNGPELGRGLFLQLARRCGKKK